MAKDLFTVGIDSKLKTPIFFLNDPL